MAFPWAAAIAAGGSVLSSVLGRSNSIGFDYDDARASMDLQKELFDYKFQKELSAINSAHQREVTDLRAAGLNPILSATGGSGLSSPSGAMPDISSVNSASVAASQANRQMKANMILGIADAVLRSQANEVNDKSANASLSQAETAKENAKINMMNAEQNAINTGSLVQQRLIQNANLDADTKKKLFEMNLINSQMYLNSAYANKALTDAEYQRAILPYDIHSKKSTSVQGFFTSNAFDALSNVKQNFNSAQDFLKDLGKFGGHAIKKGFESVLKYKPYQFDPYGINK